MTNTKSKLLEAKYFLECMKENSFDRDMFKYNLSAFLAAARSVTLIMQKEFNKVCGFKKWYTEKQFKMQNDKTMTLLNSKRNMTIHQQSVTPHAHVNVGIVERLTVSDSISFVITHKDGTVERGGDDHIPPITPTKIDVTYKWQWYFEELPEKYIVTVCKEHIFKLETLVTECESSYTS